MTFMTKRSGIVLSGIVFLTATGAAMAHPGHETGHPLFLEGLLHPLTGFDHLLAMLAVGLWSALTHQTLRQAAFTPAAFLALLLAGAVLGISGLRLPAVEPMIIASLLVLGLLVAARKTVPQWAGSAIAGFFALFHGLAHGAELPAQGNALLFVAGFMLSTLVLHVCGLFLGFKLKPHGKWISRSVGAGIAAYGLSLLAAF